MFDGFDMAVATSVNFAFLGFEWLHHVVKAFVDSGDLVVHRVSVLLPQGGRHSSACCPQPSPGLLSDHPARWDLTLQ